MYNEEFTENNNLTEDFEPRYVLRAPSNQSAKPTAGEEEDVFPPWLLRTVQRKPQLRHELMLAYNEEEKERCG